MFAVMHETFILNKKEMTLEIIVFTPKTGLQVELPARPTPAGSEHLPFLLSPP